MQHHQQHTGIVIVTQGQPARQGRAGHTVRRAVIQKPRKRIIRCTKYSATAPPPDAVAVASSSFCQQGYRTVHQWYIVGTGDGPMAPDGPAMGKSETYKETIKGKFYHIYTVSSVLVAADVQYRTLLYLQD